MDHPEGLGDADLQAAGEGLLMKAALLLVAQTDRDEEHFPTSVSEVEALVDAIRAKLTPEIEVVDSSQPVETDRVCIWVAPNGDGSLRVEAVYTPGSTVLMNLWADGRIDGQAGTGSVEVGLYLE